MKCWSHMFWDKQVLCLCATNFSQGVMLTLPFTIAVYMVREFFADDATHGEETVGKWTGLLASVYSFAQFTTQLGWGLFSNKYGRKPVLIVGNAVSTIALTWFGLAPSLLWAAIARVVGGLLNGNIGAWKCMVGESYDVLTQGKVLSYMSLAWGLGTIAGPSFGGLFSQPCKRWGPHVWMCGPGGLMEERPYFLPCLLASLTTLTALLLTVFVLEETLPSKRGPKYSLIPPPDHPYTNVTEGVEDQDSSEVDTASGNNRHSSAQVMNSSHGKGVDPGTRKPMGLGCELLSGEGTVLDEEVPSGVGNMGACCSSPGGRLPGGPNSEAMPRLQEGMVEEVRVPMTNASGYEGEHRAGADGASSSLTPSGLDLGEHFNSSSSSSSSDLIMPVGGSPWVGYDRRTWVVGGSSGASTTGRDDLHGENEGKEDVVPQGNSRPDTGSPLQKMKQERLQRQAGPGAAEKGGGVSMRSFEMEDCDAGRPSLRQPDSLVREDWTLLAVVRQSVSAEEEDVREGEPCSSPLVETCRRWPSLHGRWFSLSPPDPLGPVKRRWGLPGSKKLRSLETDLEYGQSNWSNSFSKVKRPEVSWRSWWSGWWSGVLPRPNYLLGNTNEDPDGWNGGSRHMQVVGRTANRLPRPRSSLSLAGAPHSGDGEECGDPVVKVTWEVEQEEDRGKQLQLRWYQDNQVLLALSGYGINCFLFTALDEVTPIYASSPLGSGGLEMEEVDLAQPLAFGGLVLMAYSLLGYAAMQKLVGTLRLARFGLLLAFLCAFMLPSTSLLVKDFPFLASMMLYGAMLVKAVAGSSAFTGSMIMVNVLPAQGELGQVNGVGQTLASLVRGLGPAIAGWLWGCFLKTHLPGQQYLTFAVVSVVALVGVFVYGFIDQSKVDGGRQPCVGGDVEG